MDFFFSVIGILTTIIVVFLLIIYFVTCAYDKIIFSIAKRQDTKLDFDNKNLKRERDEARKAAIGYAEICIKEGAIYREECHDTEAWKKELENK